MGKGIQERCHHCGKGAEIGKEIVSPRSCESGVSCQMKARGSGIRSLEFPGTEGTGELWKGI